MSGMWITGRTVRIPLSPPLWRRDGPEACQAASLCTVLSDIWFNPGGPLTFDPRRGHDGSVDRALAFSMKKVRTASTVCTETVVNSLTARKAHGFTALPPAFFLSREPVISNRNLNIRKHARIAP